MARSGLSRRPVTTRRTNRVSTGAKVSTVSAGSAGGRTQRASYSWACSPPRATTWFSRRVRSPLEPGLLGLQRLDTRPVRAAGFGRRDHPAGVSDPGKGGVKTVIVALEDRVELVVVAAGTADRQAEEGFRRGPDHVVDLVGSVLGCQHRIEVLDVVVGATDEEASAHFDGRIAPADDVAGEVVEDELVERLVGIEGPDHVVAEGPGIGR